MRISTKDKESLCFDVVAKYCKRLIKKRFLQEIMKKITLTNKNKCVQINSRQSGVHVSSIVIKGIRALLNRFIFFYKKISHAQKAQKAQNVKQATFLLLDVFYAPKKHKKYKTSSRQFSSSQMFFMSIKSTKCQTSYFLPLGCFL